MLRFVSIFAAAAVIVLADPQPVNIFKTDITPDEAQQYLNSPPFTDPQLSGRTAVLPLVRWNDPSFRAAEAGPTLGHYWKNGKEIENTNDYLEEVYNAAQFHGQDGLGAYTYGYKAPESSKVENRVRSGDVTGSYVYKAGPSNDDLIKVRYWADSQGFHQEDNVPKYAPKQVEETVAVKEARLAHEKAWQEAADTANHPFEFQQKQQEKLYQQWQNQGIDVANLPNIQQQSNVAQQYSNPQQQYPQQYQNQFSSGQQYQGAASNQLYQGSPPNQQYQGASNQQYQAAASNQQYQKAAASQQYQTPSNQYYNRGASNEQYQGAASIQQNQYSQPPSGPKDVIPAASNQYQSVSSQYQDGQKYQGSQQNQGRQQYQGSQSYQGSQQYQASQQYQGQQENQVDDGSYNKEKYEDPEPTGPPRGFFYSFDYPVSIIVPKSEIQGGANPGQPVDHDTVAVSGQHY
ncbi:basic-leucine zipper transcription factor A [Plodia interpunctella]|uniref:basic-leucine zipper transcription factor A n=1 Tax=Plodia interpunctella TaxID=58824 RepID=UPI002368D762|nr:basic-leucine zipper transcription factor A [Plodia interpunctella]